MTTELEFYAVKLAIAKGIYGYKAVSEEQFTRCHAAALNVFAALGIPAWLYDDEFMQRKLDFTYIDRGKPYTYHHEIRTAIDMFETGFCDELWCGPELGLMHSARDSYTLLVDGVQFETLDNETAVHMFATRIGVRYEALSRSG